MFPFSPQSSPMPRINPMNASRGLMNSGAGASAPVALNPDAGASSPQGGLMSMLPLVMGMMGQGGGQQPAPPPQAAPPSGAMNNPAAIQAAVQMMQQLRTPRRF